MTRIPFLILGFVSVALGVVGAFLPVLPTTPFLILAAFCFSKSDRRLHRWLLNQPVFGPLIAHWEKHRVIPIRIKVFAILMISIGLVYSLNQLSGRPPWIRGVLLGLSSIGIIYILLQRSRPRFPEGVESGSKDSNEANHNDISTGI